MGYPVLACTLFDRGHTDALLQPGPSHTFSPAALQDLWPRMDPVEFSRTFCPLLKSYLPAFAVPHLLDDSYTAYVSSTVLPFVDEERLGRRLDDGTIVDEGGYSRVYGFRIYDCYNQLGVSGVHLPIFHFTT